MHVVCLWLNHPYLNLFSTACQTEEDIVGENQVLRKRVAELEELVEKKTWGLHKIKDDDRATRFYTGLPSFAVFMWLFK